MLRAKACHSGLKPRGRLFGLEAIDLLLLAPSLYLGSVVLGRPVFALVLTALQAAALRLLKWRRLPRYSLAVAHYLASSAHEGTLGRDDNAPSYRAPHNRPEKNP